MIDREALLDSMSSRDNFTLRWILIALVLCSTDFIQHIDPAWVVLLIVVRLSLVAPPMVHHASAGDWSPIVLALI